MKYGGGKFCPSWIFILNVEISRLWLFFCFVLRLGKNSPFSPKNSLESSDLNRRLHCNHHDCVCLLEWRKRRHLRGRVDSMENGPVLQVAFYLDSQMHLKWSFRRQRNITFSPYLICNCAHNLETFYYTK